jgi:hypothetical protein
LLPISAAAGRSSALTVRSVPKVDGVWLFSSERPGGWCAPPGRTPHGTSAAAPATPVPPVTPGPPGQPRRCHTVVVLTTTMTHCRGYRRHRRRPGRYQAHRGHRRPQPKVHTAEEPQPQVDVEGASGCVRRSRHARRSPALACHPSWRNPDPGTGDARSHQPGRHIPLPAGRSVRRRAGHQAALAGEGRQPLQAHRQAVVISFRSHSRRACGPRSRRKRGHMLTSDSRCTNR